MADGTHDDFVDFLAFHEGFMGYDHRVAPKTARTWEVETANIWRLAMLHPE